MDDHAQNQIVVVAAANALVDEAYVLKRRLGASSTAGDFHGSGGHRSADCT
jgi:hypothetical protein